MLIVTDCSTPRIRKGWLQHLRSSIWRLSSEGRGGAVVSACMRSGEWLQHLRSSTWRLSSEGSGAEARPRTSTYGEVGKGEGTRRGERLHAERRRGERRGGEAPW